MSKKDEQAFEYWWKSHRGDVVGDEGHYASVIATEAQLYNWEREAFEAGASHSEEKIRKLTLEIERLESIISYLPKVPTQPYEKELAQKVRELEDKNKKLQREIEVLRQYGNKDCTAMADEVLENE